MNATLRHTGFARRAQPFLDAGILHLTDVHVVDRIAALDAVSNDGASSEADQDTLLGLAFAVRAPRVGHTGVLLGALIDTLPTVDSPLPWPTDTADWLARIRRSPLVGRWGDATRPFVLVEEGSQSLLQIARMASYEHSLAAVLNGRAGLLPDGIPAPDRLRDDLDRFFPGTAPTDLQKLAGVLAMLARTTVISGGPGTGKTTTIRKVLFLLHGQAEATGQPAPRVALAAPTGKAAARMKESLIASRPPECSDEAWRWLCSLEAVTLHRLLGYQPRTPSRFRHNAEHPLPVDVVIVDEASMIDVAMMSKLAAAAPPHGRLILLGDRNQLASVEAGNVLADLTSVGGATGLRLPPVVAEPVAQFLGVPATEGRVDPTAPPLAGGMVHFTEAFRFEVEELRNPIYALAHASSVGVAETDVAEHLRVAVAALTASDGEAVRHTPCDATGLPAPLLREIGDTFVSILRPLTLLPRDPVTRAQVLARIDELRVLTAHREGVHGVHALNRQIGDALRVRLGVQRSPWWTGRMVIVTENDYENNLWNGDIGICTEGEHGPEVIFPGPNGAVRALPVTTMPAHECAFALTIHKSQGSQFAHAVVVLPLKLTQILTRELVYTGISRARARLTVCADPEVMRQALERRVLRASGLRGHLLRGNLPNAAAP